MAGGGTKLPSRTTLERKLGLRKFEGLEDEKILAQDDSFWVLPDKYPVSPGHTLIVVKDPNKARYQHLTKKEKLALLNWIDWAVDYLNRTLHPKPDGFNFGVNDGPAAGQTRSQFHLHIIPRYFGDSDDPRGGVRTILPDPTGYLR